MRIASPRPFAAAIPLRVMLTYAVLGVAAIVMSVLVVMRIADWGASSARTNAHLEMADAFGLGGLGGLSLPAVAAAPSPIEHNEIVAYYGSPRTPSMGILGQHAPEDVADLLAGRATKFDAVAGEHARVLPALHLVFGVAQPQSKNDSLYVQYVDDRTIRQFIDLARRRGFVLILDLQIGHSNALAEVQKIEPYLEEPDVFVALDPEFALSGSVKPGEQIGAIDAGDINAVQSYLAALTAEHHLPKKLLIVHQFQAGMITGAAGIERRTDVDLVIDMDGYGPADIKEAKYQQYGAASYAPYGGIKVFLEHDPDPLTEQQLLNIRPRPAFIAYQ